MNKQYDFGHDVLMRSIKIIDIGYITSIYFIFAILSCLIMEKIYGPYDVEKEKKKHASVIWGETILFMWICGIIIYIIRNIVEIIPFPLDGYKGFDHHRVKELGSASVFTFFFFQYLFYYKNRLIVLYKKTADYFGLNNYNQFSSSQIQKSLLEKEFQQEEEQQQTFGKTIIQKTTNILPF